MTSLRLARYRLETALGDEVSVQPRVRVGEHTTPEVLVTLRPAVDGQRSYVMTPGEAREVALYLCSVADDVERV